VITGRRGTGRAAVLWLTLKLEERLSSKRLWRRQAMLNQEQWMEGTHRLLLPVSKMTLKR
jgi:hypothetical protein